MRILIRILLPIIILAAGWFGYTRLSVKEEQPKRPRPEPRVIRTEVLELKRQDFQTTVRTQGIVQPYLQAVLTAQVSGKVVSISESLQDGSFFIQGQELLKLDGADFEAAAFTAEANLAQAEARFAEESTKSKQARLNWQDLGYTDEPNELVLRLPQVRQAEANVKATMAALDLAIRNMERTSVTAPLTGRVLQRTTTVGQSINPSTSLATIFSTDFVEVRLPIAARDLAFLNLPESTAQAPVAALLNDAIQEGSETVWEASIHRRRIGCRLTRAVCDRPGGRSVRAPTGDRRQPTFAYRPTRDCRDPRKGPVGRVCHSALRRAQPEQHFPRGPGYPHH
jgi:multidrug efflux pump subunit AcrA (membrane-fusion protein)